MTSISADKLILARNYRSNLNQNLASSFNADHLEMIHRQLCTGLEHRDKKLKSGELRADRKAVGMLSKELEKMTPHIMASTSEEFISKKVAYVMSRVENIKPFHTLNNMVAKLFAHNLAQTAGFNIEWQKFHKDALKESVELAKKGDYSGLSEQIKDKLTSMYKPKLTSSVGTKIDPDFADRARQFQSDREKDISHNQKKQTLQIN